MMNKVRKKCPLLNVQIKLEISLMWQILPLNEKVHFCDFCELTDAQKLWESFDHDRPKPA